MDIKTQISYWEKGAGEDWAAAQSLVTSNMTRQALFFGHLAIEKILKALVCKHTIDVPPRTHNLVLLARLAGIKFDSQKEGSLKDFSAFNLIGRYPETLGPSPTRSFTLKKMAEMKEIFEWLKRQL
jgi:HEPN domain-containing protein